MSKEAQWWFDVGGGGGAEISEGAEGIVTPLHSKASAKQLN